MSDWNKAKNIVMENSDVVFYLTSGLFNYVKTYFQRRRELKAQRQLCFNCQLMKNQLPCEQRGKVVDLTDIETCASKNCMPKI